MTTALSERLRQALAQTPVVESIGRVAEAYGTIVRATA